MPGRGWLKPPLRRPIGLRRPCPILCHIAVYLGKTNARSQDRNLSMALAFQVSPGPEIVNFGVCRKTDHGGWSALSPKARSCFVYLTIALESQNVRSCLYADNTFACVETVVTGVTSTFGTAVVAETGPKTIGPLARLEVANNPRPNDTARAAAENNLLLFTIQIYLRTSNSARQFLLYGTMIKDKQPAQS